jgi:sarcosine oxidase subunit gamma
MPDLTSVRIGPLNGFPAPAGAVVAIKALPESARFVLRGRPAAIAAAGTVIGTALPQVACRAAVASERAALWLGPDEWLILAPSDQGAALAASLELAMAPHPHSLVDVSHRQAALEISGPAATAVLNSGCALDLDSEAFPVGMCTRTMLAKAEIVLWRTDALTFRLEAWRSFMRYLWRFLEEASREFNA